MASARGAQNGEALQNWVLGPASNSVPIAAPSTLEAPILIASKLSTPWPVQQTVVRPRLEKVLQAGAHRMLTLLVAPAGFGKTTLATRWLSDGTGNTPGWVSLEATDNDPAMFWIYIRTALVKCGVDVPVTDSAAATWNSERRRDLIAMVNVLADLDEDVVLVLDDFHLITTSEILDDLSFLLEQHLPRFHLVVLTRTEPPFPLSRWKVRSRVTELRARDLAFTAAETTAFLLSHELALPDEARESLHVRVGGWPAALQLAALWMSGQGDPVKAVREFASSDATIADYLLTEVLAQLPPDLRRFLLLTSVLPRLNGSLCDAVTGTSGGDAMLEQIERRGLFIHTLDRSRRWLRYHQLLVELLRGELQRTHPEMTSQLHQRASVWFAANGFAADAIEQAILARDWTAVRLLLLGETFSVGSRYAPSVVDGWLTSIPHDVLQASPFLLLVHGFVLGNLGRVDQARSALRHSAQVAASHGEDLELPDLGALRQALEAAIARLDCDLSAVQSFIAAMERELDPSGEPSQLGRMARAVSRNALAGTLYWHGRATEAADLVHDLERETVAHDLQRMRVNAASLRALVLADRGCLREAQAVATQALELADAVGVARQFQSNTARLALAVIALQHGENADAAALLSAVVDRAFKLGDRGPYLVATVLSARVSALDGDLKTGFGLLDRARTAWPGWTPPPAVMALIDAEEIQLCLRSGDVLGARAVCEQLMDTSTQSLAVEFLHRMAEARLQLAEGHPDVSSERFLVAAQIAVGHQQLSTAVSATVAAAVARRAAGHVDHAMTLLDRALELAHDENIRAPFLAETETLRPLLLRMEADQGFLRRDFRENLLTSMGVTPSRSVTTSSNDALTLSGQERAVLRQLSGNLSYRQIAASLDISINTLKTHVRNVHRKLGAATRTEAIARARLLGLI